MKRVVRWAIMLFAILLMSAVLSGCGTETETETTPEPSATQNPEEMEAEKEAEKRLALQQDGFLLEDGFLYFVDNEGNLLCDTYVGVLYFDESGRYTSGSKDLDRLVAITIRENTDEDMTRMEKLRKMYNYTRDNIKYVGFANHDYSYEPAHGENGWMVECATYALENKSGNCYHFAAAFAALARGLGYQAYVASGVIGSEEQQHGWVEIVDENGEVRYCDPETEYSRIYWLNEKHDLFYKSKEDIGATTGLGYLSYVDPFEAEKKEDTDMMTASSAPVSTDQKTKSATADTIQN